MLALADNQRWTGNKLAAVPISVEENVTVWPVGAKLPASFVSQKWEAVADDRKPHCLNSKKGRCDGFMIDMTGDGVNEVLLIDINNGDNALMSQGADGSWSSIGSINYQYSRCKPLLEKLKSGDFSVAVPTLRELEVGGQRVGLVMRPGLPDVGCKAIK